MAAQIANQSNDGSQTKENVGGVSYANVVLNSKNMDSNKENINASPVSSVTDQGTKDVQTKTINKNSNQHKSGRQPNSYASASKPSGNPEDFPQINPVNVNKRLPGKQDNKVKNNSNNVNLKTETSVNNDENKQKPSPGNDPEVNNTEPVFEVPEKKNLVEAPLPKINPWTVNKNAASVITGKAANENKQPVASNPSEKRVLQPHQQGVAENGATISQPTVVRATKDRRRINHKASDFTDTEDWPTLGTHSVREKKSHQMTNGVVNSTAVNSNSSSTAVTTAAGNVTSDETDTSAKSGVSNNSCSSVNCELVTDVTTVNGKQNGDTADKENDNTSKEEEEAEFVSNKDSGDKLNYKQISVATENHINEADNNDKKKKNARHKWVPLDIDIAKGRNKRDRSPKYHKDRNGDIGHDSDSYINGSGQREWNNFRRGGPRHSLRSGRAGGRGGLRNTRIGFPERNNVRQNNNTNNSNNNNLEYPDYPTDYTQINKFAASPLVPPFGGAFFYDHSSYSNLDEVTLTEYVRKQIEYYFSDENLMKDLFMRRKMDRDGYLPVTLIASFHRVRGYTNDINRVLSAISTSDKLQLDGFKVRTRNDPTKWPIPDTVGNPVFVSSQHPLSMHPLGTPLIPLHSVPPAVHRSALHPVPAVPPQSFPVIFPRPPTPAPYIPPPPDNLNPNVPEFIPVVNDIDGEQHIDECTEAVEEPVKDVVDKATDKECDRIQDDERTSSVSVERGIVEKNNDNGSEQSKGEL